MLRTSGYRSTDTDWKRFWYASDEQIPIEFGGFLVDPEGQYGHVLNPNARTLEALDDIACLVLLGEPGAGKSTELRRYANRRNHAASEERPAAPLDPSDAPLVISRNLADYDSISDLVHDVVHAPDVPGALQAGRSVTLLLDSFDEALLAVVPLATRIVTELQRLPDAARRARLRLRLACRSFEFPDVLRSALSELWSPDEFRVVELSPLRWRDATAAASARLGDAAAGRFMERVAEREAVPFATLPAKLDFLLRVYAERGDFPPGQADLYLAGCRSLTQEVNESRLASRRAGALDPDQRLDIASRVAAATLFGNRRAVWAGPDRGDVPSTDVTIAALLGRERYDTAAPLETREVMVTDRAVRETLGTGLFTIHGGANRVGWAHQSYAEFLAARWVVRHDLTIEQVAALLADPDDGEGRIVPQLHGVAAWLAGMRPDIYRLVAERDPQVLLNAETRLIPAGDRAVLVDTLLRASRENTLRWRGFLERVKYERLEHPALAAQLAPVIADHAQPEHVRSFAIEIAEGCHLAPVAEVCADVALDAREPVRLRAEAASLVACAGDPAAHARLLPLATTPLPEDIDDDIKGAALSATWRSLAPDALFACLTRTRRPNRSGSYDGFLLMLAQSLTPSYLVEGLRWVDHMGHAGGVGASNLEERILIDAARHAESPEVRAELVQIVRRRITQYHPLIERDALKELNATLTANEGARRALARDLVETDPRLALRSPLELPNHEGAGFNETGTVGAVSADPNIVTDATSSAETIAGEHHARRIAQSVVGWLDRDHAALVLPADLPWVIERWLAAPEGSPIRETWGEIAQHLFDHTNSTHVEYLYAQRHEVTIETAFGAWFRPMPVDGPAARQYHDHQREAERRRTEREAALVRRAVTPVPSEARVGEILDHHEREGARHRWPAWPAVAWELGRSQTEQHSGWGPGDLRETLLWGTLSPGTRDRIRAVAKEFLERARWRGRAPSRSVRFDPVGGPAYHAFRLLDGDASLAPAVWRQWIPVLCGISLYTNDEDESAAHQALLRRAQAVAPRVFARTLGRLLDSAVDSERNEQRVELPVDAMRAALGRPRAPHNPQAWNGVIQEPGEARDLAVTELLARCEAMDTPGSILDDLLGPLLAHDVPRARILARALLARLPVRGPRRGRSLAAAAALLTHAPDAGWSDVWPVMLRSDKFAHELVRRLLAYREDPIPDIRERLGEDQVAELYIWVAGTFPPHEDPWHVHVFSPGWRDNVIHWRDGLLSTLEGWGTSASLDALAKVARAFPERPYISQPLLRARAVLQSARWNAPPISDIFALAEQRTSRLVRGGEQLLTAVVESLERYGAQMQGELPAAPTLWDRLSPTEFRPKDEGHLADDVVRHLRRDLAATGVVVGCELVIDRGVRGVSAGRRTDITVTAMPSAYGADRHALGPVSLVIEVKGSWHPNVRRAMRSQLVDGYLAEGLDYRYGVYFVGWYTCDAWRDGPDRNRSARLGALDDLRSELTQQASELSDAGRTVRVVVVDAHLSNDEPVSRVARQQSDRSAQSRRTAAKRRSSRRSGN